MIKNINESFVNQYLHEKEIPTPRWMAPEIIVGGIPSEKTDVYSFGIILWEIFSQKIPFPFMISFPEFRKMIWVDNIRPSLDSITVPSICELLELCWHQNPEIRPSVGEIINTIDNIKIEYAITD